MITVYDIVKKLINLTEIQEYFKIDNYPKLVALVKFLVDASVNITQNLRKYI